MAELIALIALVSLILYALLGGADFGGGVWDWVARGPRAELRRRVIESAIAPVWEANHVWLILVVVLLFSAFPDLYANASILLHVPLTLMLLGIIFRGSAFVFRHYGQASSREQRHWGRIFALSSLLTPIFLGITLGSLTSGRLPRITPDLDGSAYFAWLEPFSLTVGFLALAAASYLAASYLTLETDDEGLREDFRRSALGAQIAVLVLGVLAALLIPEEAGPFRARFRQSPVSWAIQGGAAALWVAGFLALYHRHYRRARAAAVGLVSVVMVGWAYAQYPYLMVPQLTLREAAAPDATLRWILGALGLGALVLFPSLLWLLRIFKVSGKTGN